MLSYDLQRFLLAYTFNFAILCYSHRSAFCQSPGFIKLSPLTFCHYGAPLASTPFLWTPAEAYDYGPREIIPLGRYSLHVRRRLHVHSKNVAKSKRYYETSCVSSLTSAI